MVSPFISFFRNVVEADSFKFRITSELPDQISIATISLVDTGTGYTVGERVSISTGNWDAYVVVDEIWGGTGIKTFHLLYGGTGYIVETPCASSSINGTGFDATFSVDTIIANRYFVLPIDDGLAGASGYAFNFTVDWGDGSGLKTITSWNDADATHIYATSGTFDIELDGTCEFLGFASAMNTSPAKVTKLLNMSKDIGLKTLNFSNCINLDTIVAFGNFTSLTDVYSLFSYCGLITSIPSGIFDTCTAITNFEQAFTSCTGLTAIPTDLFKYNTAVTTFKYLFGDCTGLAGDIIPIDLFRYNTLVTDMGTVFKNCPITVIPTDLFRYNTGILLFTTAFYGCSGLTSIPATLFDDNTSVTSFSYAFGACTNLDGNAPTLWLRDPAPAGVSCFFNCTGLDNYAAIPSGWKD